MKWVDRWFMRMSKRAWEMSKKENEPDYMISTVRPSSAVVERSIDSRQKLNMSLMPATGGSILQISYYDERKDHHDSDLYIINDNEDLAPQLASILMQHKMRH
jgi:hypothetical protein